MMKKYPIQRICKFQYWITFDIFKTILRNISKQDAKMKLYIQQVIERAKVKKASKMHEHGISIARTAELLDLSQWELQSYIGKTVREIPHDGMTAKERLQKARALFK